MLGFIERFMSHDVTTAILVFQNKEMAACHVSENAL